MITTADLKTHTKADLAKMAKRLGVSGSGAMRKDQLVAAVAKAAKAKPKGLNGQSASKNKKTASNGRTASKSVSGSSRSKTSKSKSAGKSPAGGKSPTGRGSTVKRGGGRSAAKPSMTARASRAASQSTAKPKKLVSKSPSTTKKPKAPATSPKVLKRIRELQLQKESNKDIAFRATLVRPPGASEPIWEKEPTKDRIALFVRDAYWMHASWDITRGAIERAKAAMMEQWHGAKPVIRLLRMDDGGTTNTSETIERDIEIHGGLRNWYISWTGEPASFRILIGYLASNGRFHAIARSNIVRMPGAGSTDAIDEHWSDVGAESERIYAMSGGYNDELETSELKEVLEERVNRTLGAPALAQIGASVDAPFRRRGGFHFDMDIELVVYGSTVPDGYLTLNGEPVTLRSDGTFALRLPFPDRRQVLPAVACSRDGSQQRTIVVAVERNTKIMEPLEKEQDTDE